MLVLLLAPVLAKIYFQESFATLSRWTLSSLKADYGRWAVAPGTFTANGTDLGLKTTQDAKFYAISAPFDSVVEAGNALVVQFSVKFEQSIDCGGGYVLAV